MLRQVHDVKSTEAGQGQEKWPPSICIRASPGHLHSMCWLKKLEKVGFCGPSQILCSPLTPTTPIGYGFGLCAFEQVSRRSGRSERSRAAT